MVEVIFLRYENLTLLKYFNGKAWPNRAGEICLTLILEEFFSCFQAMLFYIPRWLWKNWESGKINALKMDLDLGIISEAEKRQKKKLLLDYLYSNLKNHNFWAYRYFFCEFLALINVFGKYHCTLTNQHTAIQVL